MNEEAEVYSLARPSASGENMGPDVVAIPGPLLTCVGSMMKTLLGAQRHWEGKTEGREQRMGKRKRGKGQRAMEKVEGEGAMKGS